MSDPFNRKGMMMDYSEMTYKQLNEVVRRARKTLRDISDEKTKRTFCAVTDRPLQSTNTSGKAGVTYNANAGRWQAKIRGIHLGNFKEKDAAIAARLQAETNHLRGLPVKVE